MAVFLEQRSKAEALFEECIAFTGKNDFSDTAGKMKKNKKGFESKAVYSNLRGGPAGEIQSAGSAFGGFRAVSRRYCCHHLYGHYGKLWGAGEGHSHFAGQQHEGNPPPGD